MKVKELINSIDYGVLRITNSPYQQEKRDEFRAVYFSSNLSQKLLVDRLYELNESRNWLEKFHNFDVISWHLNFDSESKYPVLTLYIQVDKTKFDALTDHIMTIDVDYHKKHEIKRLNASIGYRRELIRENLDDVRKLRQEVREWRQEIKEYQDEIKRLQDE